MTNSLLDYLSGQAKADLGKELFEEIRPKIIAALEPVFAKAWEAAWARLTEVGAPEQHSVPLPSLMSTTASTRAKPPSNVATRAKWGATREVIDAALASPGFKGMTPQSIANWGIDHGQPNVAASSVRTMLQKMRKAGEVRVRQGKYFPRSTPGKATRDEPPAGGQSGPEESKMNGINMENAMPPP